MNVRRWGMLVAIGQLLGSTAAATAQSCCMSRLGNDPQAQRLTDGIQLATVFLIIVPYVLLGLVTLRLYISRRKVVDPAVDDSGR